jgi:hypothetical protein
MALVLGFGLLSILGCVKAEPEFETLDESKIPQPLFEGETTKTIAVADMFANITISGQCHPKIREILIRDPNGQSVFSSLASLAVSSSVTCSTQCQADGKGCFTFELTGLRALNQNMAPVAGQVFQFELKGVTAGGVSKASTLRLTYSPGSGNHRILISSGATLLNHNSSGTNIKADVRVHGRMLAAPVDHTAVSAGPNPIKARIGIAVSSE